MTDTTVIAPAKIARKPVAEHEYVDEQGNELPEDSLQPEEAQGYTYTLKKTGDAFSWFWKEANDDERRMLALFGVKTLATNETSQVRNADKSVDSSAAQMEALKARFALIRTGTWVDREREGGVRVDKDKLAEAIANVLVAQGKTDRLGRDRGRQAGAT